MYTVTEAAKILGITPQNLRLWVKGGKIRYIKVGCRYRFEEKTLKDILQPHDAKESTR